MKDQPIIFSAPMIQALQAKQKSQTRRLRGLQRVNTEPNAWTLHDLTIIRGRTTVVFQHRETGAQEVLQCPYGAPGANKLWVRETWHPCGIGTSPNWTSDRVIYRADYEGLQPLDGCASHSLQKPVQWRGRQTASWRPSIFMPRWASRITLEVMNVRVERVQDITESDAWAEGVHYVALTLPYSGDDLGYCAFSGLWNEINGKKAGCDWDSNPWCWPISFVEAV